jgi:hypothetical protein
LKHESSQGARGFGLDGEVRVLLEQGEETVGQRRVFGLPQVGNGLPTHERVRILQPDQVQAIEVELDMLIGQTAGKRDRLQPSRRGQARPATAELLGRGGIQVGQSAQRGRRQFAFRPQTVECALESGAHREDV